VILFSSEKIQATVINGITFLFICYSRAFVPPHTLLENCREPFVGKTWLRSSSIAHSGRCSPTLETSLKHNEIALEVEKSRSFRNGDSTQKKKLFNVSTTTTCHRILTSMFNASTPLLTKSWIKVTPVTV